MRKKNILICFDRDGTLIYDKKYHLGHQKNWKKKVKILPNVTQGIKLLNKEIPDSKIYMISNQSGVAMTSFPLLTEKKSRQVCEYVINRLKIKKAIINGYEICGHVDENYVKRRPQYRFNKKLVCSCNCIKPKIGMISQALDELGWKLKETIIFCVGDRYIDVRTGINAKGYGILIPFENPLGSIKLMKKYLKTKDKKKTYISKDFLDACKWIIKKTKK